MTRKDYVAIAAAIKETGKYHEHDDAADALAFLARDLAATLAADNPRFDRARFLKACGVQS
jgi:hypothetical protein